MSKTSSFLMPAGVAASFATAFLAAAQDSPKRFTARELFYNAGEETPSGKPPGKPAQKSTPAVSATAKRQPSSPTTASTTAKPPTPVNSPPANATTVAAARPKTSGVS